MSLDEKAEVTSEAGAPKSTSTLSITKDKDTGNVDAEKSPNVEVDDDLYPHGLSLVVLASASMVAVFLIALDQVSMLVMPRL